MRPPNMEDAMRAITFDFWGTLFYDQGSPLRKQLRIKALVAGTGVPADEAEEALRATSLEFMRVHIEEQRTLMPEDAVDMACRRLEQCIDDETAGVMAEAFATAFLEDPPEPVEGALEAVRAAAARGPVGLISDTGISPGSSLRRLLERHGFTDYLEVLTFSDEVGVSKPQAPMFERTAAALGVAPNELFHLGDLEPTDISGVQNVGGTAGLFAGVNDRFLEDTKAEHAFRTWREFIAFLEAEAR